MDRICVKICFGMFFEVGRVLILPTDIRDETSAISIKLEKPSKWQDFSINIVL